MNFRGLKFRISVARVVLLTCLLTCLSGCVKPGGQNSSQEMRTSEERADVRAGNAEEIMSTELRSTDYLLSPEDYDIFRPGRSVDDI